MQRCTDQRGDSLSQKRIPPLEPPEKGLGLAVSGLNNSDVSEVKVPRARRSRVSIAKRFASASIIRCCAAVGGSDALRMRHTPCGCRSAHLVEVQPNFRLPPVSTMRRAQQAAFGKQSAAEQTSLAPHDSKARLQDVTICRRFMAKPCTPHPHCAACAVIRATNWQCRGSRGPPRPFSWGCKGDILFLRKRISPFAASPHGVGPEAALPRCTPPAPYRRKKKQPSRAAFLPRPRRESCPNCQYGILIPISPLFSLDNMQY